MLGKNKLRISLPWFYMILISGVIFIQGLWIDQKYNQLYSYTSKPSSQTGQAGRRFPFYPAGMIEAANYQGHHVRLTRQLSRTGLFVNVKDLIPHKSMIPYKVNMALWSDGARKKRWLVLPQAKSIVFHESKAWTFPVGTVVVKQFNLPIKGVYEKRIETRLLVKHKKGWAGYSYFWNDQETEAYLLEDSWSKSFSVFRKGHWQKQKYYIPSRQECMTCHNESYGFITGVRTWQLNKPVVRSVQGQPWYDHGLRRMNQLDYLAQMDLFHNPPQKAEYSGLSPWNKNASLNEQARSYLEVNCATCHHSGSPFPPKLNLKFGPPLTKLNLINKDVSSMKLGIKGVKLLKPGSKEESMIWVRMTKKDFSTMPPKFVNVTDEIAVHRIGQWIDQMAGK